jgi:Outer membrane receptor proteins, mostly Fe transport
MSARALDIAPNNTRDFDIPAGDASTTIAAFALQSGLSVLASLDDLRGQTTQTVKGRKRISDALDELLRNSDLIIKTRGRGTILIFKYPRATGVTSREEPRARFATKAFGEIRKPTIVETVIATAKMPNISPLNMPPIAVVSDETLSAKNIQTTHDLPIIIPEMTLTPGTNPQNTSLRMNGIGTTRTGLVVEPDIAVVLDDIRYARANIVATALSDIDNIVITRGPQSTHIGNGALSGAIEITTTEPSNETSGKLEVMMDSSGQYRSTLAISGALSDTATARLTAYYNNYRGGVHNLTTERTENGKEIWGARLKSKWSLNESGSFHFNAYYHNEKANCCVATYVQSGGALLDKLEAPVTASRYNRYSSANAPNFYRTEMLALSLKGVFHLSGADLATTTSFQKYRIRNNVDFDGVNTSTPIFTGPNQYTSYASFDVNGGTYHLLQFAEELRLSSDEQGPFSYSAGLYAHHFYLSRLFDRRISFCSQGVFGEPCNISDLVWQSGKSNAHLQDEEISAFGEFKYEFTSALSVSGGARLQYDSINARGRRESPISLYPADNALSDAGNDEGSSRGDKAAWTGQLGAKYRVSDRALIYGKIARGYKAPIFDIGIETNYSGQRMLPSETVNDAELGIKAQSLDARFTVSAALFQSNYTNLQMAVRRFDANATILTHSLTYARTAQSKGVEVTASQKPLEGLSLSEKVVFAGTKFNMDEDSCPVEYLASAQFYSNVQVVPANTCYRAPASRYIMEKVRGGVMPGAPKWRISGIAHYNQSLASGRYGWFTQLDANYSSSQSFEISQDPLLTQGGYTTVNASLGFEDLQNRYTVTVLVNNIFDRRYYTNLSHVDLLLSPTNYRGLLATIPNEASRYVGIRLSTWLQ